jgi:hypothetical protein
MFRIVCALECGGGLGSWRVLTPFPFMVAVAISSSRRGKSGDLALTLAEARTRSAPVGIQATISPRDQRPYSCRRGAAFEIISMGKM